MYTSTKIAWGITIVSIIVGILIITVIKPSRNGLDVLLGIGLPIVVFVVSMGVSRMYNRWQDGESNLLLPWVGDFDGDSGSTGSDNSGAESEKTNQTADGLWY